MKVFKILLWSALLLLVALVLFLVGSVAIDYAAGRQRMDALTNTNITGQDGAPDVRAFVAKPSGSGPFPAVIMIHEFFGLNESIVGKAQLLAEEGYFVVAPDTFRGSTTAWIPRAIYQVITSKPEQVNQDLDAVYAWLQAQSEVAPARTGVMGFCYGGRAALTYSLVNADLAATVVFYGSPETDPKVLQSLPGPVLGIFGGADRSIPLEEVQAFDQALALAGIPHEVTVYEDQPHAFVTDAGSIQTDPVQAQAWAQMLGFLEEALKEDGVSRETGLASKYRQPFDWEYYLLLVYEHAFGMSGSHH